VTIAGTAPYIKLIDITDGREKFAMVTIEGTAAQIKAGIDAIGAKVGTQFYGVSASNAAGVITVTFPLNRLLKVVANDESNLGCSSVFRCHEHCWSEHQNSAVHGESCAYLH